jgi:hypothetical protein
MVHEQLTFLYDNYFSHSQVASWDEIPYHDEPFVSAWEEYIRDIPSKGILAALSQRLVQLRFPVRAGMSNNPNYQAANQKRAAHRCHARGDRHQAGATGWSASILV